MPFTYKYPHPAVTTDCVILTFHEGKLKILLIKRGIEPYKSCWALPGGFLKMDESAEEGALRELREETGVTGCTIKQFHTFSAPGRDPRERVITIAFYALMKWQLAIGADDAEYADWIPVDNLPPLAFDHKEIIEMALKVIKRDIYFEPVGFDLLNETFSMPELQKVYEAILGKEFDRRNFAKKMKHLGILEEAEDSIEDSIMVEGINPETESYVSSLPFLNIEEPGYAVVPNGYNDQYSTGFMADKALEQDIFPPICSDSDNIFSEEESAENTEKRSLKLTKNITTRQRFNYADLNSEIMTPKKKNKSLYRLIKPNYKKLKDDDMIEF